MNNDYQDHYLRSKGKPVERVETTASSVIKWFYYFQKYPMINIGVVK